MFAPVATPSSFVLSAADRKPATDTVAAACSAPPARVPCAVSSNRAAGSVPDVRSAAEPLVATPANPVMVPAACVPVWFARASRTASAAFAVAPFATFKIVRTCVAVSASGLPVPAVVRPRNVLVAKSASLPSVTAPGSMAQTAPDPETVMSPLSPSLTPPPAPPTTCVTPALRTLTSPVVVFSHNVPSATPAGSAACPPRCRGCGRITSPVAASASSAVKKVDPSALTLTLKSSDPAVPISARPPKPVWNNRLAVSPATALFSFNWWPEPAWFNSVAGEETASRFVASGVAETPRRPTVNGPSDSAIQVSPL